VIQLLANETLSKSEISRKLGQKAISGHLNKVLKSLLDEGVVAYTIPEKPRSRAQKYRLVKSPQEKEQPGKKL
jgi:ATP-dependent DNA helicase RecG